MIKAKLAFWRTGFFPANQSFQKTFQIVLIGWMKAGPPKKPLLWPSLTKDMQTEQLLCWSDMTDTEHSTSSSSNEEELKNATAFNLNVPQQISSAVTSLTFVEALIIPGQSTNERIYLCPSTPKVREPKPLT